MSASASAAVPVEAPDDDVKSLNEQLQNEERSDAANRRLRELEDMVAARDLRLADLERRLQAAIDTASEAGSEASSQPPNPAPPRAPQSAGEAARAAVASAAAGAPKARTVRDNAKVGGAKVAPAASGDNQSAGSKDNKKKENGGECAKPRGPPEWPPEWKATANAGKDVVMMTRKVTTGSGTERTEYMFLPAENAPAEVELSYKKHARATIGVPSVREALHIATLRPGVTWECFQDNTNHAPADAARLEATLLALAQMRRADGLVRVLDIAGNIKAWTATHTPLGSGRGQFKVHVVTNEVSLRKGTGPITSCRFDCDEFKCKHNEGYDWFVLRDVDWYPAVLRYALELQPPRMGILVITTYAMPRMFHSVDGRATMTNIFKDGLVYCTTDGPGGRSTTYKNEDTRAWLDAGTRDVAHEGGPSRVYFDLLGIAGPDDPREQTRLLFMSVGEPRRPLQQSSPPVMTAVVTSGVPELGIAGAIRTVPTAIVREVESAAIAAGSGGRLHPGIAREGAYKRAAELHARGQLDAADVDTAVAVGLDNVLRARAAVVGVGIDREVDVGDALRAYANPAEVQAMSVEYRRYYNKQELVLKARSGLRMATAYFYLMLVGLIRGVPDGRAAYVPSIPRLLFSIVALVALLVSSAMFEGLSTAFGGWVSIVVAMCELAVTHFLTPDEPAPGTRMHEQFHMGGPALNVLLGVFAYAGPSTHWPRVVFHCAYNACAWATLCAVEARGERPHAAWWPADPMTRAALAARQAWNGMVAYLHGRLNGGMTAKLPVRFAVVPKPGMPGVVRYRAPGVVRFKPPRREHSIGLPFVVLGFFFIGLLPAMVANDVVSYVTHRVMTEHEEPPMPDWDHAPVVGHFDLPPVVPTPLDEQDLDPKQRAVFEEPADQQKHLREGHCKVETSMKEEDKGITRMVIALARSARERMLPVARAVHESLTIRSRQFLQGASNLIYGHGVSGAEAAAAHAASKDAEFVVELDGQRWDNHIKGAAFKCQDNTFRAVAGDAGHNGEPSFVALPGGASVEYDSPVRDSGRDDTGVGNAVLNLEGQVHALVSGVFATARHLKTSLRTYAALAADSIGATVDRGAESAITMKQFAQLALTDAGRALLRKLRDTYHWAAGDDGLLYVRGLGLVSRVARDEFMAGVVAAWRYRGHPVTGGMRSWAMCTFCSQRFYPCDPFVYANDVMSIPVANYPGPLVARALYKLTATYLGQKTVVLRGMMANDAKARLATSAHVPFLRVALRWIVDRWGALDRGIGMPRTHEVWESNPKGFAVAAADVNRTWDFFSAVYGDDIDWALAEEQFGFALMSSNPTPEEVILFDFPWFARLVEVDNGSPVHSHWCE